MSTFSKKTSIRFYPLFKLSYWKLLESKPRAEIHASFSCSWYLTALEFNICPGPTQVVYKSFWLLAAGSCDLSQAEKETTACKAEKIDKIFTQNVFLSLLKINLVIQQPKTRGHVDHQHWVSIYRFLKLVSIHLLLNRRF